MPVIRIREERIQTSSNPVYEESKNRNEPQSGSLQTPIRIIGNIPLINTISSFLHY